MVESGQSHAPAALPSRKTLPVRPVQEAGRASELVWMLSEQINILPLQGDVNFHESLLRKEGHVQTGIVLGTTS